VLNDVFRGNPQPPGLRPQSLLDHGTGYGGILFQALSNGGLEGIEFARERPLSRTLHRRIEIFPDGVPAHAEMQFDFTDRPALGPVQTMQVVDLFGRQHGAILFIRRKGIDARTLLLARFDLWAATRRKCFQNPDLRWS